MDENLDNGSMLGAADPLLTAFLADGSKTFRFGLGPEAKGAEALAADQPWPTVEAVAIVIAKAACEVLGTTAHAHGARVSEVSIAETSVNTAIWRTDLRT